MKNYRIPKFLSLTIISMIFFTVQSCKDVNSSLSPEDGSGTNQIINDPFKYTQDNLTKIGIGILNSSKKSNFRAMLYEEIEKKFDGDNNVLIKTIEENANKMNINFEQSIADGFNNSGAKLDQARNAINAFKNIEKQEYYPQVFIPLFEEKKQKGKLGINNPTIVIFNGDEKRGIQNGLTGYTFDSNGKIITISNIKEEYVKNNEVWVISLNERTISTPQGMQLKQGIISNTSEFRKSSKTASSTAWEWQFSTMTVWVNKDSGWFMGDSEVCFKAVVDFFPVSGISADYLYNLSCNLC